MLEGLSTLSHHLVALQGADRERFLPQKRIIRRIPAEAVPRAGPTHFGRLPGDPARSQEPGSGPERWEMPLSLSHLMEPLPQELSFLKAELTYFAP